MKKEQKKVKQKDQSKEKQDKSPKKVNLFLLSAWAGIASVVFSSINSLISSSIFSTICSFLVLISSLFFTYGFFELGKRYNNKFLKISSIILIALSVVYFISLMVLIVPSVSNIVVLVEEKASSLGLSLVDFQGLTEEQQTSFIQGILSNPDFIYELYTIGITFAFNILLLFLTSIMFFIYLMKLKEIKYASLTGKIFFISLGLFILSFPLMLVFIGILTLVLSLLGLFASYIFLIVILFDEAKKQN